ncbi:S-layer homology domain-containing protein [Bacillus badius]|uniref:S-layer homology domain-containing protein n=1 Tax=Bacillus badius TaxID=1455 RepID=UPI0007B39490|nr:S-layer homology domain-containing protein [Bacillus badius]KZR59336.1 hypothetical protein A3781_13120 [Bacillus badius]
MKKTVTAFLIGGMLLSTGGIGSVEASEVKNVSSVKTFKDFKDVKPDYWAYQEIKWAQSEGMIDGNSDGTFRPSNHLTQGQFVKILVNFLPELKEGEKVKESGIKSHWASDYFMKLENYETIFSNTDRADIKVVKGKKVVTYKWDEPITRGQVAQILGKLLNDNGSLNSSIDFMYANNVTKGQNIKGDKYTKYNPNGKLTRAEAVAFFKRLEDLNLKNIKSKTTFDKYKAAFTKAYRSNENFQIIYQVGNNGLYDGMEFTVYKNNKVYHHFVRIGSNHLTLLDGSDDSVRRAILLMKELGNKDSEAEIKKGIYKTYKKLDEYKTKNTVFFNSEITW